MSQLMKLIAIAHLVLHINANPCIHSYPDHTIDYITTNIGTDPSVYYLGKKASTNECQLSCMHLNYLCDTSAGDVISPNGVQVDVDACEITIAEVNYNKNAELFLTDDLVSREYIIEAQVTLTTGMETGIYWKAPDASTHPNDFISYAFAVDFTVGSTGKLFVQIEQSGSYEFLKYVKPAYPSIQANQKYTLTVHVDGTQFSTYINDILFYVSSSNNHQIDETIYQSSYAGLYAWSAGAIWHSWKMQFPDATDNQDEKFCAAYMYDKSGGNCYGYYGDDHASIESSLNHDTQHDSAVLYDATCEPTASPFDPSVSPTRDPSASPSQPPVIVTSNPTETPSHDPTGPPSQSPVTTLNPTQSPSDSRYPTVFPTHYPSNMPSAKPTWQQDVEVDEHSTTTHDHDSHEKESEDQLTDFGSTELGFILPVASVSLCVIGVVGLCIFCKLRRNKGVAKQIEISMEKNLEDANETAKRPKQSYASQSTAQSVHTAHSNASGDGPTAAVTIDNMNPMTQNMPSYMSYPTMANSTLQLQPVCSMSTDSMAMAAVSQNHHAGFGATAVMQPVQNLCVAHGIGGEKQEEEEYAYDDGANSSNDDDVLAGVNMVTQGGAKSMYEEDESTSDDDLLVGVNMVTKGGMNGRRDETPPGPVPPPPPPPVLAHGGVDDDDEVMRGVTTGQ
eukprot:1044044_1